MQKEYVYFDWNVVKYAKQPRAGKPDDDLLPIITRLSKRYHIPYSEAEGLGFGTTKKINTTPTEILIFLRN